MSGSGSSPVVLASRSPRRRELLAELLRRPFDVVPPADASEPGFEDCHDLPAIEHRVRQIALAKHAGCCEQLEGTPAAAGFVIAADTVVVGMSPSGACVALGQPPDDATWPAVVADWFRTFYSGRTHTVLTGLAVSRGFAPARVRVVRTEVTMQPIDEEWLAWYLSTGESPGKAGGYAIQGLGSLFVERIEGSLTNVIGLPLTELRELLKELGSDV